MLSRAAAAAASSRGRAAATAPWLCISNAPRRLASIHITTAVLSVSSSPRPMPAPRETQTPAAAAAPPARSAPAVPAAAHHHTHGSCRWCRSWPSCSPSPPHARRLRATTIADCERREETKNTPIAGWAVAVLTVKDTLHDRLLGAGFADLGHARRPQPDTPNTKQLKPREAAMKRIERAPCAEASRLGGRLYGLRSLLLRDEVSERMVL